MAKFRITPFLWFDNQAEQAAKLYTSVFPNSKLGSVTRYTEAGREHHGQVPGTAMTVSFELDGQPFTALNGGPIFEFTEAVSFQVHCETQAEVDHYWEKLGAGGDPKAQRCGWLKDKFGLSWQIVPNALMKFLSDPNPGRAARATEAMMGMSKLVIADLEKAANG